MWFFVLATLLPAQQPAAVDIQQLKSSVATAYETYFQYGRKLNGSISIYQLDGDKKTLQRKIAVKADKTRYLVQESNGEQRFVSADVFRPFGDVKQWLHLEYNGMSSAPRIQRETYRKDPDTTPMFPVETMRTFSYSAPAALPLRPVAQWQWTLRDMLECPGFKITAMEQLKQNNVALVKITFEIDKAIDDQQGGDLRMGSLFEKGTMVFRPEQCWAVQSAEMMLKSERRKPARLWTAEFTYGSPSGALPVLKEVRVSAAAGRDADQKPVKQLYEVDFKPVEGALPDEQFGLKQFNNMQERTPEAWLRAEDERARLEAEEKAKIALIPPEKLKPASQIFIDPRILLWGGVGAFVFLVLFVIWVTGRKPVAALPPDTDPSPTV